MAKFETKGHFSRVFYFFLLYKTNRFHVAVRLFSNRSQRTSKCGKNISDTLGCPSCATFLFLPHFDVICDLLLNRRTATWNLFVKCEKLVKELKYSYRILPLNFETMPLLMYAKLSSTFLGIFNVHSLKQRLESRGKEMEHFMCSLMVKTKVSQLWMFRK